MELKPRGLFFEEALRWFALVTPGRKGWRTKIITCSLILRGILNLKMLLINKYVDFMLCWRTTKHMATAHWWSVATG